MRSGLRRVPVEERARMHGLPETPETFGALAEEVPFWDAVEVVPAPVVAAPLGPRARIVCWNAERGRHLEMAAELLSAAAGDAYLLSELDWGMARTGQNHTTRELAHRLGCGYAYAVEFLELGLGDERERAAHAGQINEVGYHGGALLSANTLEQPEVVRIERSGLWFGGTLGERRIGGRIAVLADLSLGGTPVTLASVHLESHSDPDDRCEQFARVLDAVETRSQEGPAVVGGDVNTSSLTRRHEPLFALAESRGFDWRPCNRLDEGTQRFNSPSRRGKQHLDWFFCRGLDVSDPEVIAAVDERTGTTLSDHEVIAVTVELR